MPELIFTEQVGVREALSDLIAMTDVKSTPIVSMAVKDPDPLSNVFQWQADSYKEPSFDGVLSNEDVKGFDDPAAERVLLEGRVQKFRRVSKVDDFAENVNTVAGVKSEMARAVKKDLEHIKRDIESAICSDRDSQKQNGTNPNRCRGLGKWISDTAQSDLPVPESQRTPTASIDNTAIASLTADDVQDVLQSIYEQVGKPQTYVLLCGPTLKRKFSSFTQTQFSSTNVASSVRTYLEYAGDKRITATVDVFEGDCGTLELLLSLFLAKDNADPSVGRRRGYVLPMDGVKIGYKRRPRFKPLEDQGGGPRGFVDAIVGWKIGSPLGFGKFDPAS